MSFESTNQMFHAKPEKSNHICLTKVTCVQTLPSTHNFNIHGTHIGYVPMFLKRNAVSKRKL